MNHDADDPEALSPEAKQPCSNRKKLTVFGAMLLLALFVIIFLVVFFRKRLICVDCVMFPRDISEGSHGAVVSGHHLATAAGMDVLRNGGNAVDAAAAVQFVLNVVQVPAIVACLESRTLN